MPASVDLSTAELLHKKVTDNVQGRIFLEQIDPWLNWRRDNHRLDFFQLITDERIGMTRSRCPVEV